MLNINEELLKFEFIDVESVEEKIGRIPDDMKNAIDLYNKALDDLKSDNEDIAIIALKKAISIYPAFYEAMNLMGICYLALNDEDNARRMFNKVIQMEDNSIRATRYLNKMDGIDTSDDNSTTKTKKRSKKVSTAVNWLKDSLRSDSNRPNGSKFIIFGVLIGVLAMCLIWILLPTGPININMGDLFKKTVDVSPELKKLAKENSELSTRLNDANEALRKANETEKQLRDQIEKNKHWSAILRNLQVLAGEGKYKEVVLQIERDLAGLDKPEDIAIEIDDLNSKCKPRAVTQFYESARTIYKSNANARSLDAYKEAADEFTMAINIIDELDSKPSIAADVYYYGGKAIALSQYPSREAADEEAIRCFNAVIEIAPRSELASYSRARINEIEAGKTIKH